MGGGSGSNNTTAEFKAPSYALPTINKMIGQGTALANRPYQAYKGDQVADMNSAQNRGIGMAINRATNGSPYLNQAGAQVTNTLGGKYMGQGAYANPMANQSSMTYNPYITEQSAFRNEMGNTSSATQNAMAGQDNPYLQNVINNTNSDVMRQFTQGQMPQTDAAMARAGAFGGSAWRNAQGENNRQMAAELAKNTSNLRMQDYGTQQQLAENYANRQQQDIQSRQQMSENYANRLQQQAQTKQQMGENQAGRQQADIQNRQALADAYAGRRSQAYDAERNRQMGMVQAGQDLADQRYKDANTLLQVGSQQQKQQQNEIDARINQFMEQRNYPIQQLDMLRGLTTSLMGTGNTSIQQNPNSNRYASGLGGALAGGMGGYQLAQGLGGSDNMSKLAGLLGGLGGGAAGYFG